MDISERFKCYVFGQCEVGFHSPKEWNSQILTICFSSTPRSTLSILKLQTVLSPATSSVAKIMTACGGHGSQINQFASSLLIAPTSRIALGIQTPGPAMIASVDSEREWKMFESECN